MKTSKLILLIGSIAVALFILIPNLSWAADDGTSIYKAKCAVCHGADGTIVTLDRPRLDPGPGGLARASNPETSSN